MNAFLPAGRAIPDSGSDYSKRESLFLRCDSHYPANGLRLNNGRCLLLDPDSRFRSVEPEFLEFSLGFRDRGSRLSNLEHSFRDRGSHFLTVERDITDPGSPFRDRTRDLPEPPLVKHEPPGRGYDSPGSMSDQPRDRSTRPGSRNGRTPATYARRGSLHYPPVASFRRCACHRRRPSPNFRPTDAADRATVPY